MLRRQHKQQRSTKSIFQLLIIHFCVINVFPSQERCFYKLPPIFTSPSCQSQDNKAYQAA